MKYIYESDARIRLVKDVEQYSKCCASPILEKDRCSECDGFCEPKENSDSDIDYVIDCLTSDLSHIEMKYGIKIDVEGYASKVKPV